jgi:hypothetical protein
MSSILFEFLILNLQFKVRVLLANAIDPHSFNSSFP